MLKFAMHNFAFSNDYSIETRHSPYWQHNGVYLVIETDQQDTSWFSKNDCRIIERYYDGKFSCTYLRDTERAVIVHANRVEIPIRHETQ